MVDPASDEFYRRHLHSNYGEVGLGVKELVDAFSQQSAAHKQVGARGGAAAARPAALCDAV